MIIDRILVALLLLIYPASALLLLTDFQPGLQYYQQAHWFSTNAWQAWCISLHARAGDALVALTGVRFLYSLCTRECGAKPLYYEFWLLTWQVAMLAALSFSFLAGDQRAYWSLQVITRMPAYLDNVLPWHAGTRLSWLLTAGSTVSVATFLRWRAFHLGYCFVLVGHGLWWSTVRRLRLWSAGFGVTAVCVALLLMAAAWLLPEAPGLIANPAETPSPVPVIWHQWPMMKLASVCSPLMAMAIIFAVLLSLFLLPLARRSHARSC